MTIFPGADAARASPWTQTRQAKTIASAARIDLFSSQCFHERFIDQFVERELALDAAGVEFLLNHGRNRLLGDLAVYRKGIFVLVVSGRRHRRIHLDVLPDGGDRILFVFVRVADAALISAEEARHLVLFLREPRLSRGEGLVRPLRENFLQVEELVVAFRFGDLGNGKPHDAGIDAAGLQRREARRRAADLQYCHLFRINPEVLHRRAREIIRQRAEATDREALPLRVFHRFEIGIRVKLERHDVADAPEVLYVHDAARAPADRLDEGAAHDLHVAAGERLDVSRAGVEHDENDVESLVLEEAFFLGDVNGQEGDVDGGKPDNDFGAG